MLFRELNRNNGATFTHFVVKTSNLVSDLAHAQRGPQRARLPPVDDDRRARRPAGPPRRVAATAAGFMRLANTTFVNLRSALDDLKPLVDDSKPVAPKLQKLLVQLRPLAATPSRRLTTCQTSSAGRGLQRPDRAGQARRTARRGDRQNIYANGKVPPRRVPGLHDRPEQLHPGAGHRPSLRRRSHRLVRGLHPPGHHRRQRWRQPHRAGGRRRLDRERRAQPAPVLHQPGAPQRAGPRRDRPALVLGGSVRARPGTSNSQGVLVTGQGDRCPGSMERGALYYPESGFPCNPPRSRPGNEAGPALRRDARGRGRLR